MSKIDPPAGWPDVDGIDTFERLLGGPVPGSPMNRSIGNLVSRTKQLRADLDAATAVVTDIGSSDAGKGAALVGFPDAAAPAYLKTSSDLMNGLPVNILRNIPKNRWSAIQNGTDTQDCAQAIMDLMDGAYNARCAVLRVPMGRFTIHKPIQRLAGTNPFRLVGDDMMRSVIVRGSDWLPGVGTGSVFSISGVSGHSIENLRINGNATLFPTYANHAIACSNSNNVRYRDLYIEDWKNASVVVFHHPGVPAPGTPQEVNNVIERVYSVGNGDSNNGVLLVDQENSYITDCVVLNLGQAGSPQYGLQLKNSCVRCHISGGIVVNARAGVGFGQEGLVGPAVSSCSVSNVLVKSSIWGIYLGQAYDCTLNNIDIDMKDVAGDPNGGTPIELADSVGNSLTNIRVSNQRTTGGANAPYTVYTSGASTDNVVSMSSVKIDSATTPRLARMSSTSARNAVSVQKLTAVTTPLAYSAQAVNNENTSSTAGNTVQVAGYPGQDSLIIAAGVVVLRDARVSIIRVNTEAGAATDDLDTITGPGIDGQTITLKTTSNSRDVTVKHGTGNIRLAGGADFPMLLVSYRITLQYDTAVPGWTEVSRSAST